MSHLFTCWCRGCGVGLYGPIPDGLCFDCTMTCIHWHISRGKHDLHTGVVEPVAVDEWLSSREVLA